MSSFAVISPILIITLSGYLLRRYNHINRSSLDSLTRMVFDFVIPILLFKSTAFSTLPSADAISYVIFYYIAATITYFISFSLNRIFYEKDIQESGIFGLGSSFSNTILVGVPFILAAYGEEGMVPLFSIVTFQAAYLFSLTTFVCEMNGNSVKKVVKSSARAFFYNPIIISLILGMCVNFFDIYIPETLVTTISLVSGSSIPLSLIVLGAILYEYNFKDDLLRTILLSTLKLLLFPLILITILLSFKVDIHSLWAKVSIITAAFPTGVNSYVFSKKYDKEKKVLASTIIVSTFISIFTLTLFLEFL